MPVGEANELGQYLETFNLQYHQALKMTWFIITTLILTALLGAYCAYLYYDLYMKGYTKEAGRVNLGKLNRSLNEAKSAAAIAVYEFLSLLAQLPDLRIFI